MPPFRPQTRQDFLKFSGYLAFTGAIGSLIALIAMIVLGRLYSPSEFGDFKGLMAGIMALVPFNSLRYEFTVWLPQSIRRRRICAQTCTLIAATFSLITFFVLIFVPDQWIGLTPPEALLFALILFGRRIFLVLQNFSSAENKFLLLGSWEVQRRLTQNLSKIGFGVTPFSSLGLMLGECAGTFFGILRFSKKVGMVWFPVRIVKVLGAIRYYRKFPIVGIWSAALASLSQHWSRIGLLALIGSHAFGSWNLAALALSAPMTVLGAAIARTYPREAAGLFRDDPARLFRTTVKLFIVLGALYSIPAIILFLFSDPLIPFVFGENWKDASQYLILILPAFWLESTVVPISTFNLIHKQEWAVAWNLIAVLLTGGALGISYALKLSTNWTILLFSLSMTLSYFVMFAMYLICLRQRMHDFSSERKLS